MRFLSEAAQAGLKSRPSTEEIRAHLERVLVSAEFSGAPRLARFLSFVVETALTGNSGQIKETLVAVEVYGRRPDYNPQIDSTVRVEAGRLRARLRRYRESSGRLDPIQIELPKGTYAPVFSRCIPDAAPARFLRKAMRSRVRTILAAVVSICVIYAAISLLPQIRKSRGSTIDSMAVLPFVNLGDDRTSGPFCDGLTEELSTLLGRDAGVRVVARSSMARYRNESADIGKIGKDHAVRAVLEGSVRPDGNHIIVTAQLVDTRDGYHLWADRYERNAGDLAGAQREVASIIVSRLHKLVRGEAPRWGQEPAADSRTQELFHRANDLLRIPILKNGPPGKLPDTVIEAVQLFKEITVRSLGFARGWAGLAEAAEWNMNCEGTSRVNGCRRQERRLGRPWNSSLT